MDNREKNFLLQFPIVNFYSFPSAEVGGGASVINAICSRSEVADDVISGYNVETFRDYYAANL